MRRVLSFLSPVLFYLGLIGTIASFYVANFDKHKWLESWITPDYAEANKALTILHE